MNTIRVITELCPEDRARLDAILAALQAGSAPAPVKPATEPAEAPAPAPVAEHTPEAPQPAEQPAAQQKTVNREQLRAKVVELAAISKEKKAAVRAIVTEYAPTVPEIPEDKLAEAWDKLVALEG